jgi:hypothetical protein
MVHFKLHFKKDREGIAMLMKCLEELDRLDWGFVLDEGLDVWTVTV